DGGAFGWQGAVASASRGGAHRCRGGRPHRPCRALRPAGCLCLVRAGPYAVYDSQLLGTHSDIAIALLYNGIIGDHRPQGSNVLTRIVTTAAGAGAWPRRPVAGVRQNQSPRHRHPPAPWRRAPADSLLDRARLGRFDADSTALEQV